jgi:hypothetical protein
LSETARTTEAPRGKRLFSSQDATDAKKIPRQCLMRIPGADKIALVVNLDSPLPLEGNVSRRQLDGQSFRVDRLQVARTQMPMNVNRRANPCASRNIIFSTRLADRSHKADALLAGKQRPRYTSSPIPIESETRNHKIPAKTIKVYILRYKYIVSISWRLGG